MSTALRLATEAEILQRNRVAAAEWGAGLSEQQFQERERRLREHSWARERMHTWLLVGERDAALASCETFRIESTVGDVGGSSWIIASVVTEPRLRRRGYARALLMRLCDHLRDQERAQAAVLFSEVGSAIYASVHFRAVPGADQVLTPLASASPYSEFEWCQSAPAPFVSHAAQPNALRLVPTAAQLDWHLERERFYAEQWERQPLKCHGARRRNGAAISWTAYWKTNELHVLSVEGEADDVTVLLDAARVQAHQSKLDRVRVWHRAGLPTHPAAQLIAREAELPMFLPFTASAETWVDVDRVLWA